MTPAPVVTHKIQVSHSAIDRAVTGILQHQPRQARTGASHGAAWCDSEGNILLVRENVGRHNALDELFGALKGVPEASGFVLVTSRASYEMVAKTAQLNIPLLASVSAPTALAIETAKRCAMTLIGFSQPGRHVVYTEISGEMSPR